MESIEWSPGTTCASNAPQMGKPVDPYRVVAGRGPVEMPSVPWDAKAPGATAVPDTAVIAAGETSVGATGIDDGGRGPGSAAEPTAAVGKADVGWGEPSP